MKFNAWKTLVLGAFIVSSGCGSVALLRGPSYASAAQPPASPELATLYIVRRSATSYGYPQNKFLINGELVTTLTDQEYSWVQLPPGRHHIQERGTKTEHETFVDLKGGESYFVLFDFVVEERARGYGETIALQGVRTSLALADERTALGYLRRSSYREAKPQAVAVAARRAEPVERKLPAASAATAASAAVPALAGQTTQPSTGQATTAETAVAATSEAEARAAPVITDPRNYITVLIYIAEGKEELFRTYERRASVLMARYGGRIEYAIKPESIQGDMDPPDQVQLLVFETADGFERYRADPESKELAAMRADAVSKAIFLRGRRVAIDPAADS